MVKRFVAFWVCMTCVLVIPNAMATNGYFAHGYGTKNKGMAGAGVALPQDTIAAATNPAGMVHLGERFDGGLADQRGIEHIERSRPGLAKQDVHEQWRIVRDWIAIFFREEFEIAPDSFVTRLKPQHR